MLTIEKTINKLNSTLSETISRLDNFQNQLSLVTATVTDLQKHKSANVLKKMEEDIAVLDLLREIKDTQKRHENKLLEIEGELHRRPCHANPALYSKIMHELANERIDTSGKIFLILDREGKVKAINPYGAQFLGQPATEIIDKSWIDNYVPKPERERIAGVFDSLLKNIINGNHQVINNVITKKGSRAVEWKNYIFTDNDDNAVSIISLGIPQ